MTPPIGHLTDAINHRKGSIGDDEFVADYQPRIMQALIGRWKTDVLKTLKRAAPV